MAIFLSVNQNQLLSLVPNISSPTWKDSNDKHIWSVCMVSFKGTVGLYKFEFTKFTYWKKKLCSAPFYLSLYVWCM